MRILEINTERGWRGGERQTLLAVQGFQELGLDVTLLCRTGSKLAGLAGNSAEKVENRSGFWGFVFYLLGSGKKFDVIHVHTARDQTLAVLTKWVHKRPIVYSRRVEFVPKGSITQWKYSQTDQVVAISKAVATVLEEFTGKPIPVIPDCLTIRTLSKNRADRFLLDQSLKADYFIGTMAALTVEKDPFTMLKAIKRLSEKRSDFVFLHFGDGILKPELEAKIEELGLKERYKLLGHVDEVEDFFSILSVYLMSSEREGLGSTVLEAMAYEVPVVSTDAGGLKETVGDRGFLSPVGDVEALASNINQTLNALSNSELTPKRLEARDFVLENYSVDKVSAEYQKLFSALIIP